MCDKTQSALYNGHYVQSQLKYTNKISQLEYLYFGMLSASHRIILLAVICICWSNIIMYLMILLSVAVMKSLFLDTSLIRDHLACPRCISEYHQAYQIHKVPDKRTFFSCDSKSICDTASNVPVLLSFLSKVLQQVFEGLSMSMPWLALANMSKVILSALIAALYMKM